MKRILICFLCLALCFTSCAVPFSKETRRAEALLRDIMTAFSISDGFLYHKGETAEHPLTDDMLSRMFDGEKLDDLRYVRSMAVYFSRRYTSHEIIVIELFDQTHKRAVAKLLEKRAMKKENAVIFSNGVYLYLLCTEQNEAIKVFLQG